jgi:predicted DCC family thiol-disulfide oxidoreductase YuxK
MSGDQAQTFDPATLEANIRTIVQEELGRFWDGQAASVATLEATEGPDLRALVSEALTPALRDRLQILAGYG